MKACYIVEVDTANNHDITGIVDPSTFARNVEYCQLDLKIRKYFIENVVAGSVTILDNQVIFTDKESADSFNDWYNQVDFDVFENPTLFRTNSDLVAGGFEEINGTIEIPIDIEGYHWRAPLSESLFNLWCTLENITTGKYWFLDLVDTSRSTGIGYKTYIAYENKEDSFPLETIVQSFKEDNPFVGDKSSILSNTTTLVNTPYIINNSGTLSVSSSTKLGDGIEIDNNGNVSIDTNKVRFYKNGNKVKLKTS